MLQTITVEEKTLGILKMLMCDEKLKQFHLVGGTALALYMGHRKSIDLDLFSQVYFNVQEMEDYLKLTYNFRTERQSNATLIGNIDFVKVDFINYNYPLVMPVNEFNCIRMYSMQDISAMKLTAISQSGKRLKDFVDIAFLSTQLSLDEMLNAFKIKFPHTSVMSAVRGLSYYEDIDFSAQIDLISGTFKWKTIEKRIIDMIKYSDRVFPAMKF